MLNELNKPEQNALGDGTTAAKLGAKIAWQAQTLWLPYRTSSLTPSTASVSLAASSHALTIAFGIDLSPVETKFGPFSDSPAGAKNA